MMEQNQVEIKAAMRWENYDLNQTIIPIVDKLRDDAFQTLIRDFGRYVVEDEVYPELLNDIFIYFPVLAQELSITRLIDAYAVNTHDTDTESIRRTESLNTEQDQNSILTTGTSVMETGVVDSTVKNTGTTKDSGKQNTTQSSETNIINTSDIDLTTNHSMSMQHNLPEQALDGTTGKFPIGDDNIPSLGTSYIQNANESYASNSPAGTDETSDQTSTGESEVLNENTMTNDLTTTDKGTNTSTRTNSGSDMSDSVTLTKGNNVYTEDRELNATNKQYAYEVTAFLNSAASVIAFRNWTNRFSWVIGFV